MCLLLIKLIQQLIFLYVCTCLFVYICIHACTVQITSLSITQVSSEALTTFGQSVLLHRSQVGSVDWQTNLGICLSLPHPPHVGIMTLCQHGLLSFSFSFSFLFFSKNIPHMYLIDLILLKVGEWVQLRRVEGEEVEEIKDKQRLVCEMNKKM